MSVVALPQPPMRKTDGWSHQLEAYHFVMERPESMLAMDMGTGKSWVVVQAVINSGHMRTLIVCPVSVMPVWPREFAKHAGSSIDVLVLDKGSTVAKMATAEGFMTRCRADKRPCVVVVNYETMWRTPMGEWIIKQGFDCAVLDESHRIKSPGSKASRFAHRLGKTVKHRLCLTGTPLPHSPLDAYGQYRFLDPSIFGTSFVNFRSKYAICHAEFKSKVLRWINGDELKSRFHSIAYTCDADDVLDLPDVTHITRPVTLTPKTMRLYKELEKELVAGVESGVVVASNALTKLLRLQQITGGFVGVETASGEQQIEVLGGEKQAVLTDILYDLPEKEPVVVFCRFRHDLESVRAVAEKTGRRYGEISGSSKDGLDDQACMAKDIDLLGVQIQSGGVGIDLTRARYCVYYSLGFNMGDYMQSLARTHRPGQTRSVFYYHLVATGTVDQAVYGALKQRKKLVDGVMNPETDLMTEVMGLLTR